MSEDQSDRTFEATEQKLRRARQEGDIPRSQEANAALLYLGFWGALALMGATMVPGWLRMAARTIGAEPWPDKVNRTTADLGWATGGYAALSALAAIALMGLCVLLGMIAQRTIVFTPQKAFAGFLAHRSAEECQAEIWQVGPCRIWDLAGQGGTGHR